MSTWAELEAKIGELEREVLAMRALLRGFGAAAIAAAGLDPDDPMADVRTLLQSLTV